MKQYEVKKIFKYIKNNQFNEARLIVEKIYSTINPNYTYKADYLKGLVDEAEKNYLNKDTQNGLLKEKYLLLGNKSFEEKDYKQALEYYKSGFHKTRESIFNYYQGLCYFELKDYFNAEVKFFNYTQNGFEMLDRTYYYMTEIAIIRADIEKNDTVKNKKRYAKYLKKSDSYLTQYYTYTNINNGDLYHNGQIKKQEKPVNLITSDIEVEELISNGKLNDVIEIYEETTYSRKVTILALLYMNGFDKLADKTYKKDKDDLRRECYNEVQQLNKNKTLYKMKHR